MANIDPIRRAVLVNMAFNMGINGLLGFKHTLELVRDHKYADAADSMLNSKWAHQVGVERAAVGTDENGGVAMRWRERNLGEGLNWIFQSIGGILD
jgi:hypothetical protein